MIYLCNKSEIWGKTISDGFQSLSWGKTIKI
jgi:hypothetical protein